MSEQYISPTTLDTEITVTNSSPSRFPRLAAAAMSAFLFVSPAEQIVSSGDSGQIMYTLDDVRSGELGLSGVSNSAMGTYVNPEDLKTNLDSEEFVKQLLNSKESMFAAGVLRVGCNVQKIPFVDLRWVRNYGGLGTKTPYGTVTFTEAPDGQPPTRLIVAGFVDSHPSDSSVLPNAEEPTFFMYLHDNTTKGRFIINLYNDLPTKVLNTKKIPQLIPPNKPPDSTKSVSYEINRPDCTAAVVPIEKLTKPTKPHKKVIKRAAQNHQNK